MDQNHLSQNIWWINILIQVPGSSSFLGCELKGCSQMCADTVCPYIVFALKIGRFISSWHFLWLKWPFGHPITYLGTTTPDCSNNVQGTPGLFSWSNQPVMLRRTKKMQEARNSTLVFFHYFWLLFPIIDHCYITIINLIVSHWFQPICWELLCRLWFSPSTATTVGRS